MPLIRIESTSAFARQFPLWELPLQQNYLQLKKDYTAPQLVQPVSPMNLKNF